MALLRRFSSTLRSLNREMKYEEVVRALPLDAQERKEHQHAMTQHAVRQILLQRNESIEILGASAADPVVLPTPAYSPKSEDRRSRTGYLNLINGLFMGLATYLTVKLYRSVMSQFPVKEIAPETISAKFSDVQGMDEAKAELQEVVDYLRDSKKYIDLGVNLPRGVLLTGDPGTGKTLLARAIAGEAGVKFYYTSGSEFEEIYVGLGAKRVRELFKEAKKNAPAVIFIDEIDSVGGTRRNDQYAASRQSLNQLLVEMDGFDRKDNVVVIAATNLPSILDPALSRAGRFDKEVHISPPDFQGRESILRIYMNKVHIDDTVDIKYWARLTTGTTGADLANFVNTAALRAVKMGRSKCAQVDFEFALDRIYAGIENRTLMSASEKLKTAIHEVGHVLGALLTEGTQSLHKVTILSRGQALGYTFFFPHEKHKQITQTNVFAQFDVSMGGHVAEEMFYGQGDINTGCTQDMQTSTQQAYYHVRGGLFPGLTGLSNTLKVRYPGPMYLDAVDEAVKMLLAQSLKRTVDKLRPHKPLIKALAERLVEKETMTGAEVKDFIQSFYLHRREVLQHFVGLATIS